MIHAIAASTPWWPHLITFPRFLDPISWWWLSVKGYALTSSWFNVMWIIALLLFVRHHNCHQKGCMRHGKYAHGHLMLCGRHHPALLGNKVDADHIDAVSDQLSGKAPNAVEENRKLQDLKNLQK
jgi:hypothetical protein